MKNNFTRRDFLKAAGASAVPILGLRIPILNLIENAKSQNQIPKQLIPFPSPIRGSVWLGQKTRAGIAVSDGFDIVLTDAKGRYELPNKKGVAQFIFVIVPDDVSKAQTGFYKTLYQIKEGEKKFDFNLPDKKPRSLSQTRFVQITDVHTTDLPKQQAQYAAAAELLKLDPKPDFIFATGDLVEHGSNAQEMENYTQVIKDSPIPYFNLVGNHDAGKNTDLENFLKILGPDYYSFDNGGAHFIVLDSVVPSERQKAWFEKDVAMFGKGKPVVLFQHYPPTTEDLKKFDKLNIHSIFTGHWHSDRIVKSEKTVSVTTPAFDMGGIDFSPAGFRVVEINSNVKMNYNYRPIGVSKFAKIVWPAGDVCKGEPEIIANIYDSSIDAKKVRFSLYKDGKLKSTGLLKQKSLLCWSEKFPDFLTGDEKISIEIDGHPDWKAENNFTRKDCEAPAIKTNGDWPMFMGNAKRTGVSSSDLNLPLSLVWSTNTEGDIDLSSPILAAGKLFVTVKARRSDAFTGCMAIEPATGKVIWRFKTEQSVNHSAAFDSGVICITEVGGRVYGLSAETGKQIWTHDLGDNTGRWVYSCAAVDEGKFYAGTINCFARLDAKTGNADWQKRLADEGPNDWISTHCSPAISGKYLAMGGFWVGKNDFYLLEKETGNRLWMHPADRGMHSSPTIADDKVLFFGKDSLLHCANISDGKLLWTKQVGKGWAATTCAVKGEIIVTGDGTGQMKAFKISDGTEIWVHQSGQSIFKMSPYMVDNRSVLSSPTIANDKVFFGSTDGKLYCLDLEKGNSLWSFDFGVPVLSTPLVNGNALFVAAYDGRVYAFSSQTKNISAFAGRNKNEYCNWQRPCRFSIQRGNQESSYQGWV